MSKIIKVLPVASAMVPDFKAQQGGVLRFVGRKLDRGQGGFAHDGNVVELDIEGFEKEYLEEIRAGALLCADEASARICGVKWNPIDPAPDAA